MKIVSVKKIDQQFTLDIEVEGTHTYQLENGMISHNTSSLVLGTSSGIHAWHSPYYIRRMRVGKNENIYKYLAKNFPALLVDEYFKPTVDSVIELAQRAPDGAITREESALDLLKRVTKVWKEWVKPGHRRGANRNNVSTTVTIKPGEWETVGAWMWENRDNYTALTVLPFEDHNYPQLPYEDITKEQYEERIKGLHEINLDDVTEINDETKQAEELACAGGSCDLT